MFTESKINWLIVFSIFATAIIFFKFPFEFYLFYVPIILLTPYFVRHYKLSRIFILLMLLLGITSIIGIFLGYNSFDNFIKTYVSVFFIYTFYYYGFAYNNFKVDKLFALYAKFAYVIAVIGVIQFVSFYFGIVPLYNFKWFLNKWTLVAEDGFIRINSIISEPSQFAFVLAPIIFVSIFNIMNKAAFLISKKRSYLFLIVGILTLSTHAYIIILLSVLIIIVNRISFSKTIMLLTALFFALSFVYNNYDIVRERIDDSLLIVNQYEKVQDPSFLINLNSSTFTLLNNYQVAIKAFERNPIFGGGLGSHPMSFDAYSLTKSLRLPFEDFNKMDANSLLLRLLSETGLIGLTIVLVILFKFRYTNSANIPRWVISQGIVVMLVSGLLREGHYFHSGVPFFLFLYIFNCKQAEKENLLA